MKLWIVLLIGLTLTGCATSHVATDMGGAIGQSFQKSAAEGVPTAEQTIKAWPYVSGLIKGLTGEEYDYRITVSMKNCIVKLDELSRKDILTQEEKGIVVGSMVRLEFLSGQEFWNKYGVSLFASIKSFTVGG
jgi:hypothetical protein